MKNNKFAEARKTMGKYLAKDEGLYIAYKANIAMWIYDHSDKELPLGKCNEIADGLISLIWSIPPEEPKS